MCDFRCLLRSLGLEKDHVQWAQQYGFGESGSFEASLDRCLLTCFSGVVTLVLAASRFLPSFGMDAIVEELIKLGIIDIGIEGPNAAASAGERTESRPGFKPVACVKSGNRLLARGG